MLFVNLVRFHSFSLSHHFFHSLVIKPHPVDERLIFWETEQPRFIISRLGQWGNGANFNKAKTQCFQFIQVTGIFIKTCAKSNRVCKRSAQKLVCLQTGLLR